MSAIDNRKSIGEDELGIDFSAIMHQLIEQKWLIILITSICLGIGIYYASKLIPQYQSDVLIQIDGGENSHSLAGTLSPKANNFFAFSQNNNEAEVQKALIKSRFILIPVIESLGLNISISPQNTKWNSYINPSKASASIKYFSVPKSSTNKIFTLDYEQEKEVKLLDSNQNIVLHGAIGVPLVSQDGKIQLEVQKIDAPIGKKFTIIYRPAEEVVNSLASRIKIEEIGRSGIGIFSISIQQANPQLSTKIINEVAHVAQQKNIEIKSIEAKKIKNFLSRQLSIAKEAVNKAEQAFINYRRQSGKFDLSIQGKALIQQILSVDKQMNDLRLNKAVLAVQYTKEHPTYIEMERRLKIAQNEKNRLEQVINELPSDHNQLLHLTREVKTKQALLAMILDKIQGLEIIEAGLVSNVKILSHANVPNSPMPLPKNKIYLGSVLIGLILSVLAIFGRKLLFPKIEDPHWTETYFGIPNLAIVPYSSDMLNARLRVKDSKLSIPLLAKTNHRSITIEVLRSLRTSLQLDLSCASNNIVSILGVSPGIGKTFVSTNLAYLLATVDKRVLLIDADLRRGIAHKYFNIAPSPGFAELIQGTASPEEVLKQSSNKNLMVLPRGNYPSEPSELLACSQCKDLLIRFSTEFDIVIIDTPALMMIADAVLISSLSAINYLLLASKVHQPSEVEVSFKRLASAGVNINGTIFNFNKRTSHNNSYYSKYCSYKYYDKEKSV